MNITDYTFLKAGEAGALRPALVIRLVHPSTGCFQDTTAIIDTGASQCCVPASYADVLDIDLSKGQKTTVRTANTTTDARIIHGCGINVWDTHELFKSNAVIACTVPSVSLYFVSGLNDVLLGVSFLNQHILTIDYHREVFSLREP